MLEKRYQDWMDEFMDSWKELNWERTLNTLDKNVKYRKGELLNQGEDESYDIHEESDIEENIYMHCKRAIERACNFGRNNLPKIGSGDWNDGFSTVRK